VKHIYILVRAKVFRHFVNISMQQQTDRHNNPPTYSPDTDIPKSILCLCHPPIIICTIVSAAKPSWGDTIGAQRW
jgi:hypothetical protein